MTQDYDRQRGGRQPGSQVAQAALAPGRVSRSAGLRMPEHPIPSVLGQLTPVKTTAPHVAGDTTTTVSTHSVANAAPSEAYEKIGGKVFKSPRFMGDPLLAQVVGGSLTLGVGARGLAVSRLQSALTDAGHPVVRTGTFDPDTEISVMTFQESKSLNSSGVVDKPTLSALDEVFADYSRYAALAQHHSLAELPREGVEYTRGEAPAELMKGTVRPSAAEASEAFSILAALQDIDVATGEVVTFDDQGVRNGRGPYRESLTTLLNERVDAQFVSTAKDKGKLHADPNNLHSLNDMARVGQASKARTDAVFGSYAVGRAFDTSTNLRDRWVVEDQNIQNLKAQCAIGVVAAPGGPDPVAARAELVGIARWRVQKIINEDLAIAQLNAEYGAILSRAAEAQIVNEVVAAIAEKREDELLEIHKGWPAAADPQTHEVFMQLFKSEDSRKNRRFMWRSFQMLTHEYIHTLEHSRYRAYSDKLTEADSVRGHALREGATDYLTTIVLSNVNYNDKFLRAQVEGPYHDPATVDPPLAYSGYPQAAEAEQVVGVVGARNMYAAYFLGEVELIGASP